MSRKGENIYKRKDGRWEGRYMKGVAAGGKTIYGSCYGKTYREAKEKLEHCKLQVLTGKRKDKAGAFRLFCSYCDEWLAVNKSAIKESTAAKYTVALKNNIKPYFGEYSPQLITTEMTADFVDELLTVKKLSPKTAKDIAIILKSILKYISIPAVRISICLRRRESWSRSMAAFQRQSAICQRPTRSAWQRISSARN